MSEPTWAGDDFRTRIQGLREGTLVPVPTRDAATVVLIRDAENDRADGTGRLEVFMLRRVVTMAFGPGLYVFPGGKVDPSDDAGPDLPGAWARALTHGDQALLRRVVGAAIRETEEEAGVVLTHVAMQPFAHWITPEMEPRRYDTRFLLAALPAGQTARRADDEADHGLWVSPQAALELPMMPPTEWSLRELTGYPDVTSAIAVDRVVHRIAPIVVAHPDGGWHIENVVADVPLDPDSGVAETGTESGTETRTESGTEMTTAPAVSAATITVPPA